MKKTVLILITLTVSTLTFANTQTTYIADNISLPVRVGPGSNQKISNRLLPGTKVTILRKDEASKYYLVQWASGKSGWVAASILTNQKPAIARLKIANYEMQQLRKKIERLSKTGNTPTGDDANKQLIANINDKITTQASSINKLKLAVDTLSKENRQLILQLQQANKKQTASQTSSGESNVVGSEIDWFLWGGFVVGLSFGAGILISKIRWKKDTLFL